MIAFGLFLFLTALTTQDPLYGGSVETVTSEIIPEDAIVEEENTLTLWYTDDALTDYLTTEALSFQNDTGIKVNPVLVSGVEYLEHINSASLTSISERRELPPDVYITTHDSLLRAYLAGIAVAVDDYADFLVPQNYPQTSLDAVTCYGSYVGYPLYYETNFFLYNKTYMASIAQNKIESEADIIEGEAAQEAVDNGTDNKEESGQAEADKASENENSDEGGDGTEAGEDAENSEEIIAEDGDPMGDESQVVSPEVLQELATMIPETLDDITTFANNYDAPEAVESVFEWDVTDIFYNYFFVGNYMEVGGQAGDNTAVFNIYNQQAVECLTAYQKMNEFFSIDASKVSYDSILDDFINGKTVFTVATTDAIAKIQSAKEKGDFDFDFGVTTLPDVSKLLKSRGLSVTTAVAVNGYSTQLENSKKFARYLTENKSADLYRKAGKIACRTDVSYDNDEISHIMDEYNKSVPLPKMVEASNYWVQLEIAFTKIWNGADPDATLSELSDTMGAQIDEIRAQFPTQETFKSGAGTLVF